MVLDAQQGHVCSAFFAGLPVKGRYQEEAGLEMSPRSGVAREHWRDRPGLLSQVLCFLGGFPPRDSSPCCKLSAMVLPCSPERASPDV